MWFWPRGWKRRRPQSGQWWASVCSCLTSLPPINMKRLLTVSPTEKTRIQEAFKVAIHLMHCTTLMMWGSLVGWYGTVLFWLQGATKYFKFYPHNNGNILLACASVTRPAYHSVWPGKVPRQADILGIFLIAFPRVLIMKMSFFVTRSVRWRHRRKTRKSQCA